MLPPDHDNERPGIDSPGAMLVMASIAMALYLAVFVAVWMVRR